MKRVLNIFIIPIFSVILYFAAVIGFSERTFPQTKLGLFPAGFQTKKSLIQSMERIMDMPITINTGSEIIHQSPRDLGLIIDHEKTLELLFAPYTQPLPQQIISFYKTLITPRIVYPIIIGSEIFEDRSVKLLPESKQQTPYILVDVSRHKLIPKNNGETPSIDSNTLIADIATSFGKYDAIIKASIVQKKQPVFSSLPLLQAKLLHVFSEPISVVLKQNGKSDSSFLLTPIDLQTILSVSPDSNTLEMTYTSMPDAIEKVLGMHSDETIERHIISSFTRSLIEIIKQRIEGKTASEITVHFYSAPNTDGSNAKKYIEIDLSQQKMYLFSYGTLQKSYAISSGLDFPTPPGSYAIMNKASNAFSKIYNVYMPWWMGFYMHPELGASLGIHELPYWISPDGKRNQRPSDFIGSPHTGGCIALEVGAAKIVYDFADIGTPVLIYN